MTKDERVKGIERIIYKTIHGFWRPGLPRKGEFIGYKELATAIEAALGVDVSLISVLVARNIDKDDVLVEVAKAISTNKEVITIKEVK